MLDKEKQIFKIEAMYVQVAQTARVMLKYVPVDIKKPTWGNTTQKVKDLCAKDFKPNDKVLVTYTQEKGQNPFVMKVEKIGTTENNEPKKQETVSAPINQKVQEPKKEVKSENVKGIVTNAIKKNNFRKILDPERYLCPVLPEVEERIVRTECMVFAGKALVAMSASGGVTPNNIVDEMRRLFKVEKIVNNEKT